MILLLALVASLQGPEAALSSTEMARSLEMEWRWEEAEEALRRAIVHDPNYYPAHHGLIFLLRSQERFASLDTLYAGWPAESGFDRCLRTHALDRNSYRGSLVDSLVAWVDESGPDPCSSWSYLEGVDPRDDARLEPLGFSVDRAATALERRFPESGVASMTVVDALERRGRIDDALDAVREALASPERRPEDRVFLLIRQVRLLRSHAADARAAHRAALLEAAVRRDSRPGTREAWLWARVVDAPYGVLSEEALLTYIEHVRDGADFKAPSAMYSIGIQHADAGRPRAARRALDQSLTLADSLGLEWSVMRARLRLGRELAATEPLPQAVAHLETARGIAERLDDPYYEAEALHNLTHLYERVGDTAQADSVLQRWQQIARTRLMGDPNPVMSLRDGATFERRRGRPAAARDDLEALITVVGESGVGSYWMGEHLESEGRLAEALEMYRLTVARDDPERPRAHAALARVLLELGRPDSALVHARAHDERHLGRFGTPVLPRILIASGDPSRAAREAQALRERRSAEGNTVGAAVAGVLLARARLEEGEPVAALEILSGIDPELLLAREPTDALGERIEIEGRALLAANRAEEAVSTLARGLEIAERQGSPWSRLDLRMAYGEALLQTDPAHGLRELQDMSESIAALEASLSSPLDRARLREEKLRPYDLAIAHLVDRPSPPLDEILAWVGARSGQLDGPRGAPELRRIQDVLGTDAAIQYVVLRDQAWGIGVDRNHAILRRLESPDSLRAWVDRLLHPFRPRQGRVDLSRARLDRTAANRLHATLIAPFAPLLDGAEGVILAPDGPLHRLPFDALPLSLEDSVPRYLVDRWSTRVVRVVGVTPSVREGDEPRAVGRAVLVGTSWAPGVVEEVQAVEETLSGWEVQTLTDEHATESRLREALGGADLLHVSTHAIANAAEPLAAHLALSPEPSSDGLFEVSEILEAGRGPALVFLSACETHAGAVYGGTGLFGLARGFQEIGATRVVATLWPTGATSAQLAAAFYDRLVAGAPAVEALAGAKRALRADPGTEHPFHWAGFTLVTGGVEAR